MHCGRKGVYINKPQLWLQMPQAWIHTMSKADPSGPELLWQPMVISDWQ
jgi:hypothetical protein